MIIVCVTGVVMLLGLIVYRYTCVIKFRNYVLRHIYLWAIEYKVSHSDLLDALRILIWNIPKYRLFFASLTIDNIYNESLITQYELDKELKEYLIDDIFNE